jgi:hypothetical protein
LQLGIAGLPGQPGYFLPYFFFNPARFQPRVGRVPGRPVRPGFKTIPQIFQKIYKYNEETTLLNHEFIILFLLIATILKAPHRAIHR